MAPDGAGAHEVNVVPQPGGNPPVIVNFGDDQRSGTLTTSGSAVTVSNASYNGSLAAGASATFGFIGTGAPSSPAVFCTSP